MHLFANPVTIVHCGNPYKHMLFCFIFSLYTCRLVRHMAVKPSLVCWRLKGLESVRDELVNP